MVFTVDETPTSLYISLSVSLSLLLSLSLARALSLSLSLSFSLSLSLLLSCSLSLARSMVFTSHSVLFTARNRQIIVHLHQITHEVDDFVEELTL